jgi:hypothetical protein
VITSWESKFGWERWGDFLGHEDPAGLARYITTGGLVVDSPGFALDRVTALFTDVGIPYEVLSAAQLRQRCATSRYVAIGTSGNQFKNAPVIGQLMTALITECEAGRDHDADPVIWRAPHTALDVDLSHYSRLRAPHASSGSVMG